MSVLGGADLDASGAFQLRFSGGSVNAYGEGSSINFGRLVISDTTDSDNDLNIAHGASVVAENAAFAQRYIFANSEGQPRSTVGGHSEAHVSITNGGSLTIKENASFAAYYADPNDFNDGSETALATVLISGAGSEMILEREYAQFGISNGGVAEVTISNGGSLVLFGGADFGGIDDATQDPGGQASVTIVGSTSSLVTQANGLSFARGEGSVAHLEMAMGARLEAGEYLSFAATSQPGGLASATIESGAQVETTTLALGRNGGTASMTIDDASVTVSGSTLDGWGAFLTVGRDGGDGELAVINGGKLLIDGEHGIAPGFTVGRNGGTGQIVIDGAGSAMTVAGDAPDLLDPDGFAGSAYMSIGRDAGGEGILEILNDAVFTNTDAGFIDIGRADGVGTVTVDGDGSIMNGGDGLRIGHQGGTGLVEITNSAALAMSDQLFDGEIEVQIQETGELHIFNAALLRGDVENNGLFLIDATMAASSLNGDLRQSAEGEMVAKVGGASSSAALSILGGVTLDGGIVVDFAGSTLSAGQAVVLLEAVDGLAVNGDLSVTFKNLSSSLDAQIVFDDDSAVLLVGAANEFADDLVLA